ncbi:universal stress protein [Deminuibacter soli]|uniref:Universal stress protein n=1 Tax=Deminuibacter soli TaxID=2291815 RepID=A0A3E1NCY8_9BACT|nr:universal stress protein [Deminuibacter soli]RFM25879.1 universal stress protein [Deminuibacter soli]
MQTILVPTDFSETAKNATRYALQLAAAIGADKIILYNAYQIPVTADPMMPTLQLFNLEEIKAASEEGLSHFADTIQPLVPAGISIETLCEFNVLAEGIGDVIDRTGAGIIVMGITGGDKVEEVLIGSNTISVSKHAHIPVIIVPADCSYQPIKAIALACDLKKVVQTTPVEPIKTLLQLTGAAFSVVNISGQKQQPSDDKAFQMLLLDTLFQQQQPAYFFIENDDFTEAIQQFVVANKVDLLITIPKKHGWFEGLFKRSHTKRLAFHSHIPLMVAHE